jgi:hypothetical protein
MVASDYIAISAVVIAMASLYVAIQQVSLMRSHNRLSVRPMLTVYRKRFSNHPVEYSVANHGLGPAIIKSCSVLVDHRIVNAPEGNVLFSALSVLEIDKINVGGNLLGSDEVLENGQEVVLLRFTKSH